MDASILSSDETQATQIIDSVLPQHSMQSRDDGHADVRSEQLYHGQTRPDLVSSSSRNGSTARYHYFGLASTQTDSQVDGAPVGRGSHQETADAYRDVNDLASHLTIPSRSLDHSKCLERKEDVLPPNSFGTASPFKSGVTSTLPIPSPLAIPQHTNNTDRLGTVHERDTSRPRRRRSPSPASQDSFAGPLPPDAAEKLFVANTTAFNIPLVELQQSNADNLCTPQTPSSVRTTSAYSFSAVERRVPLPAPPRPLGHTGEVLVAETPSNSSRSSCSQSVALQLRSQLIVESPSIARQMQGGDTQPAEGSQPHAQPRGSLLGAAYQETQYTRSRRSSPVDDISTEPSSSYERVLGADPYAPASQAYAATQPATQRSNIESTQIVDATEDTGPSTSTGADAYDPFGFVDRQYPAPSPGPSIATTNTTMRTVGRGLAGLIPAHRRWQYQVEEGPPTMAPRFVPHRQPPRLQRTAAQDTQPSDTNAINGSAVTNVPLVMPPSPPSPRHPPPCPIPARDIDVVPDSEPMDVNAMDTEPEDAADSPSKRVSQLRLDSPVEEVLDTLMTDGNEDDEDEDDVPLALASGKGKQKAQPKASRPNVSLFQSPRVDTLGRLVTSEALPGAPAAADIKALQRKGRELQYRTRETSAAPSSSKASEDTSSTTATRAARSGVPKKNVNRSVARGHGPPPRATSRSMTPASAMRQRRSFTGSSDDATAVSKDNEMPILNGHGEGSAELAGDEYMDVDEDDLRSRAPPMKRKRVNSISSKRAVSKATTRSRKTSNTPIASGAKKRKTASSTVTDGDSSATRVYALWRQDNHYYSGTVYSLAAASPPRYVIQFDDGDEDVVEIAKMRVCKLMVGDQVLVQEKQKAVVVDVARFDSNRVATVEMDNGEELDRLEVGVREIRIASRTLNSAWTDRVLAPEDICPIVKPTSLADSPSPSKMTLGSAASVKSLRRMLGKTGFIVTMSPKNEQWETTKEKVLQAIKANGGIVIDNWTDIYAMDGTYSQGGKRWVVRYEDIKCVVRNDIQQVFLLADNYNAKPKYLIALALGIPCLDFNWILRSVGGRHEKDWQEYLLPAGLCESLGARVSQLVDLDWGNSSEHLREITGNKVAPKVFTDMRILCVSQDYVPAARARKNAADADMAKEASRMVPRIILTMGASSVEAVPDIRYASSRNLAEYDYVVVKDSGDIGRVASGANCVPFGWVKDCLIAGRLLPQSND